MNNIVLVHGAWVDGAHWEKIYEILKRDGYRDVLRIPFEGLIRWRHMRRNRPALFKGRHFEREMIILCVRRYLRFCLSYRDVEELMAERNLHVDHVTFWRGVRRSAPELNRRCRPELRTTNRSWR